MKIKLLILGLVLVSFVKAQVPTWENPNFRSLKIKAQDSLILDSMFILNDGLKIKNLEGEFIPDSAYEIDYAQSIIYFKPEFRDSLQIEYYVHPTLRSQVTYPKDPKLIVASASEVQAMVLGNQETEKKEIFDGISTQGSMVRGISLGNNQGSSAQSSLDLRMNGQLSQDIGITAAISDTNVPIEADGYTQNLEQFDKVFVELFTDQSSARAGHVDLSQTQEYFGRFNRRVSGLHLNHMISSDSSSTHFQAAGSISRGEFKQMKFNGQEGNQGPYRLSGNYDEAYVTILSGSEKIYKDGILLQRGENYDYVINYNTGEITFTNKHLVRSTDRFIAEYQYTNRYYNRFMLYGGAKHVGQRFSLSTHIYSESDSKNNAVNQSLSLEDKEILSQAGNDAIAMYADSYEQVPFEEGKVLYKKVYWNDIEIFEYTAEAHDEVYNVNFTRLGKNKGNYKLSDNAVNGRVFEFVPPINGVKQGEYEPIRLLVAPQKNQVLSLASSYKLKNNGKINLDVGVSNVDQNLFSDVDDEENVGYALKLGAEKSYKRGRLQITPSLNYEFIKENFSPLERLRSPEFVRDFNLNQEIGGGDQQFLQSNILLAISDSIFVNYGFDYLDEANQYNGNRHRLNLQYLTPKTEFLASYKTMNSSSYNEKTTFDEYRALVGRQVGKVRLTTGIVGEQNRRELNHQIDSLSFGWNEVFGSVMLGDTINKYAYFRAYQRKDDSVSLGRFKRYLEAVGMEFNTQIIKNENHALRFMTHYRRLNYTDSINKVSLLNATIQWRKSLWNKAVELNANYEISGGAELQRAFTYVEVADGMGIYKWTDYNGDGIQQLDEFEQADFADEAKFIRVYTNTVDQIRTNKNGLRVSLRLNPSRYFGNETFWRRVQSNLTYSTEGNYLKYDETAAFNPWQNDESLRFRTLQFYMQNKYNTGKQYKWNFVHEFSIQENARYVFTGLEKLSTQLNKIKAQYNWTEFLTLEFSNNLKWIDSDSEAFESRRYALSASEWIPKAYYSRSENFKYALAYKYQDYSNALGEESLKAHQLNFDFTWSDQNKTSVLAGVDWVKNDFVGNPNSVVGNRMMEGLRDGNNLVWRLLLQRNINNYLELNVQYSGRKNEEYKAIHSGNVQLKLNF